MTKKVARLKSVVRNLTQVIEKERKAIIDRAFDKISELTIDKADQLDEFEKIVSSLDDIDSVKDLEESLNALRLQAEKNAAQLKSLGEGVDRVRARLKQLSEQDLDTGAYRRDGGMIKSVNTATLSTKI